ncbi:ADP-glyceromanno-heptose 6-epimerase [Thalassospiraceae bacterium LMO-JJ14]|nr:ADP-glyceromanno-heptose 6-epimerase [Thalassospiraceae bacterium LMO-JJ14]
MYVITGGAGFIGSNVAAALEARGTAPLVIVDRLRDADKWRNIAKRTLHDIVHPDNVHGFLKDNVRDVKGLVHMGAISATTETDADLIVENNFRLSRDLWNWCADNDIPYIYASSAATYGDGAEGFDDDMSADGLNKLRPLNPYGWSKLLFDKWVAQELAAGHARPRQWAGLRFFNVYGPNEYHKGRMASVVSQIQPLAAKGEACRLFKSHHPDYEDGGQLRDFVSVDDCADVILWLLDNPSVSGLFNLGTGKARSFADLARAVYTAMGQDFKVEYVPTPEDIRDKYQYFTEADMTRLRDAGYAGQFTSLEDGVGRYVRDFLGAADPYR